MVIPHLFVAADVDFVACRCLAMDVRSDSAIQAFRWHAIISSNLFLGLAIPLLWTCAYLVDYSYLSEWRVARHLLGCDFT
jgi:hypothetical protein